MWEISLILRYLALFIAAVLAIIPFFRTADSSVDNKGLRVSEGGDPYWCGWGALMVVGGVLVSGVTGGFGAVIGIVIMAETC